MGLELTKTVSRDLFEHYLKKTIADFLRKELPKGEYNVLEELPRRDQPGDSLDYILRDKKGTVVVRFREPCMFLKTRQEDLNKIRHSNEDVEGDPLFNKVEYVYAAQCQGTIRLQCATASRIMSKRVNRSGTDDLEILLATLKRIFYDTSSLHLLDFSQKLPVSTDLLVTWNTQPSNLPIESVVVESDDERALNNGNVLIPFSCDVYWTSLANVVLERSFEYTKVVEVD